MSANTIKIEILTIKRVAKNLKITDWLHCNLTEKEADSAFEAGGASRFSRADIDSWEYDQI